MELETITAFLTELGFTIVVDDQPLFEFLPGIHLGQNMFIQVRPEKMISPGDLLHEAGHIAVIPSLFRPFVHGDIEASLEPLRDEYYDTHEFMTDCVEDPIGRALLQCSEAEAIAWSYAAAMAIGLPPERVFHDSSFDGEGEDIIAMLSYGAHFGVHGLQAAKMTTVKTYPTLTRWLQV